MTADVLRRALLPLCWVVFTVYLGLAVGLHLMSVRAVAAGDAPAATDFDAFYAASLFVESHPAAQLFDQQATRPIFAEAQQRLYGPLTAEQKAALPPLRWYYPPSFLLAVAPLAKLPPLAAKALWLILTCLPFLWVMRRSVDGPLAIPAALAWPASFMTILFGQNGFLTAGLLGGGLILLETRPWLAGALFGLAAYKPHLALPVGLALLAGGYWRAIAAAGLAATAAILASTTAFGLDAWAAFVGKGGALARAALESGDNPWSIMPTAFAATRSLGGGVTLAWQVQAAVSLAALAAIGWAWRGLGPFRLKAAVVVVGGLLATPFGYIYDQPVLAATVAWLLIEVWKTGWRPYEKLSVATVALLPFAASPFTKSFGFQPGPVILGGFLAVLLLRLREAQASMRHCEFRTGQRPTHPA